MVSRKPAGGLVRWGESGGIAFIAAALALLTAVPAQAAEFTGTRFRFKSTKLRGNTTTAGTGFQISEFRFVHNGVQVPWGSATLTSSGGSVLANKPVNNIKDGSTGTDLASSKSHSLNVWFDGVQIVTNLAVDLTAIGAANAEGKSWVGFGSRTGGYSQNNDITRWTLASTIPVPPFRITSSAIDPATGQGSLTWLSEPGKTYRITGSLDLASFPLEFATGIPSEGTETTAGFSFPPGTKNFFRIEEEP